jgi:DNA polymerase/3'-5' exonuclease PolX
MQGKIVLERAQKVADAVVKRLAPYCHKIEVAGSIRRRRPRVNDIDIVLIPSDLWTLHAEVKKMGTVKAAGAKIMRVIAGEIQVDLYIATRETWATLMLIRTGSVENNIRLCSRAKEMKWQLHADGSGLFNDKGERIAGDSEISIYNALGLRYQEPWERQ